MKHYAWLLGLAMCSAGLTGCVDRRFVVLSDPPGAFVYVDNEPRAYTPADDHFIYYGNRRFTLVKDGYQTLQVDQKITTPWYQYFPLDFFFENIWPFRIVDRREFVYQLTPLETPRTDQVLDRAQNLRNRGMSIGEPLLKQNPGEPQSLEEVPGQPRLVPPAPAPETMPPTLVPPHPGVTGSPVAPGTPLPAPGWTPPGSLPLPAPLPTPGSSTLPAPALPAPGPAMQ